MKTRCAWIVLVLVFAGDAHAQVSGGVKGGAGIATLPDLAAKVDDPTAETSARVALAVGAFVSWQVGEYLAIQPELLYVQKGVELRNSTGGPFANGTIELAYLEVPVLAVARVRGTADRALTVFAGPSIAFAVRTRAREDGADRTIDLDDDVKDTEFSIVFGAGATFGRVLVEGRWIEGLTSVNEPAPGLGDIRNRTGLILAGVSF